MKGTSTILCPIVAEEHNIPILQIQPSGLGNNSGKSKCSLDSPRLKSG